VYAPEGITSLLQPAQRLLRDGLKPTLLPRTLLTGAVTLLTLVGAVIVIELLYHRSSGSTEPLSLFGVVFDHQNATVWLVALVSLVVGGLSLKRSARWMWEGIEDAVHSHDMNLERSPA
jgi:branched-chain amino acid transport system permease protein